MTDRGPPLYHHSHSHSRSAHAHAYSSSPSHYGGGTQSGSSSTGSSSGSGSSSTSHPAALLPHPQSGHAPRQLQPHAHAHVHVTQPQSASASSYAHSHSSNHHSSASHHSHHHHHSHTSHSLSPAPQYRHNHHHSSSSASGGYGAAPSYAPSHAQSQSQSYAHSQSQSYAPAPVLMAPPPPPPPPPAPAPAPAPVNPGMQQAVEHATHWWANQLKKHAGKPVTVFSVSLQAGVKTKHTAVKPLSAERVELFRRALFKELITRYEGHWYDDDVQRGSGYRSVSYDSRVDTVLNRAARACGLDGLEKLLAPARFHVMFVNPGEVKVLNTVLMSSDATYVWQSAPNAAPPPLLPLQAGAATTLVLTSATPTKPHYKSSAAAAAGAAAAASGSTLSVVTGAGKKSKLSPHASPFGAPAKPDSTPSSPPPGAGAGAAQPPSSSQTPPRSHSTSPVLPPANGGSATNTAAGSPVLSVASGVVNPSAALLQAQAAHTAQLVGGAISVNTPPLSPPLSPPLPAAAARTSAPGAGAVDRALTVSPPPAVSASAVLTIKQMLSTIVDRVSTDSQPRHRPHSQSQDSTLAGAPGISTPSSPPSGDSTPLLSPSNAAGGAAPFGAVPPPQPLIEQTA